MGMPTTSTGTKSRTSNEHSVDTVPPESKGELSILKNEIKSLKSIIDSLQQENLKLNKSYTALFDKYNSNVSSPKNTVNTGDENIIAIASPRGICPTA